MKNRELIRKLLDYNMDADVNVIAHNRAENFSICFGGNDGEGVTKENTSRVSIYVDALCHHES